MQTALGGLLGVAAYVAILATVFTQEPHPDDPGDLRPLDFIVYAAALTPVLLITAGVLSIWRRIRPIGLGLLLGVLIGLVGTLGGCYALW